MLLLINTVGYPLDAGVFPNVASQLEASCKYAMPLHANHVRSYTKRELFSWTHEGQQIEVVALLPSVVQLAAAVYWLGQIPGE